MKQLLSICLILFVLIDISYSQYYTILKDGTSFENFIKVNNSGSETHYIITSTKNGNNTNQKFQIKFYNIYALKNKNIRLRLKPHSEYFDDSNDNYEELQGEYTINNSGNLTTDLIESSNIRTGIYTLNVIDVADDTDVDIKEQTTFIIIEALTTKKIDDYTFHIRHCEQYFDLTTEITYTDFLNILDNALDDIWNSMVGNWNLCKGTNNKPTDSDNIYEIYIHPMFDIEISSYYKASPNDGCFFSNNGLARVNDATGYASPAHTYRQNIYLTPQLAKRYSSDETKYQDINKFLKIITSHEFLHGVQAAYDMKIASKNNWLVEGMARFIQTEIDPVSEFTYNVNNKGTFAKNSKKTLKNFHNRDWEDIYEISYNYCIFWRHIFEKYGNGQMDIIQKTLNEFKNVEPELSNIKSKMDNVLGGSGKYAEALQSFAKALYFNENIFNNWQHNDGEFYHQLTPDFNDINRREYTFVKEDKVITYTNKFQAEKSFGIYPHEFVFNTEGEKDVLINFNKAPNSNTPRATLEVEVFKKPGIHIIK